MRDLRATDRRLRFCRALETLTWFAPATCLWLLASWLLGLGAASGSAAALWPSWAGGAILLLLALREATALGRDLPAAARAVDRAGDLHDTVATGLEMQERLGPSRSDGRGEPAGGEAIWPLPWVSLVLERAVAGLERNGPRQTAPRLVPRGALWSAGICLVLLLPVALPRSLVGEALAAAMSGDAAGELPPGFEAAALLEGDPDRIPGIPELDARLSDLPFVTLRVREPDASDGAPGDASEALEGSLGDGAEAEALDTAGEGADAANGARTDEANPETGADLMRELDNREGAGEEEKGAAPGAEGNGEGAEPGAEAGEGDGSGGQPTEDGEGSSEGGTASAVSDEPGSSEGEADGAAAGVGTGPQEEMVDPFGDLLVPALSLEQALQTALLESIEEIERRPLTTTSATRFRAAEVAMRGPAPRVAAGAASASGGDLPAARHPIAWRHRDSVRRYLDALASQDEETGEAEEDLE